MKEGQVTVDIFGHTLCIYSSIICLVENSACFITMQSFSFSRREAKIAELIHSYDVYEDLMAKSQKGLEFYKKLESNVSRLLQRCKGIVKANHEERAQISKRFASKGKLVQTKSSLLELVHKTNPMYKLLKNIEGSFRHIMFYSCDLLHTLSTYLMPMYPKQMM